MIVLLLYMDLYCRDLKLQYFFFFFFLNLLCFEIGSLNSSGCPGILNLLDVGIASLFLLLGAWNEQRAGTMLSMCSTSELY